MAGTKPESKFAGILKNRIAPTDAPASARTGEEPTRSGRRRGKKSNPDYRLRSLLLRNSTHRKATDKIRALDNGTDLSEVVNELLEQWTSA